jgi:hypothetical protein
MPHYSTILFVVTSVQNGSQNEVEQPRFLALALTLLPVLAGLFGLAKAAMEFLQSRKTEHPPDSVSPVLWLRTGRGPRRRRSNWRLLKILWGVYGTMSALIAGSALFWEEVRIAFSDFLPGLPAAVTPLLVSLLYALVAFISWYHFFHIWRKGPSEPVQRFVARILLDGDPKTVAVQCQKALLALGAFRFQDTRVAEYNTARGYVETVFQGGTGRWPSRESGERLLVKVSQRGPHCCLVKLESCTFWPRLLIRRNANKQNINRLLDQLLRSKSLS